MSSKALWPLTAAQAVSGILAGEFTSVEMVSSCLERIGGNDASIGAWACLDADTAIRQAETMDDLRRRGMPTGALHGVPVGIKDIYDTADMPTAWGVPEYTDRLPAADSAVVERLREAGAVILGKTVTTPLAFSEPAATRNPLDPARTPGGSSSGSAAGVAAGHMPLSIGSQTNGSIVRPASFCGIVGYKPTRGIVSRRGCLQTSETLDQVGLFARTLEDAALIGDAIAGYDAGDPASYLRPRPRLVEGVRAEAPVEPALAWFEMPFADRISDDVRAGFEELIAALGDRVERIPAPGAFTEVVRVHNVVHEYEFEKNICGRLGLPDEVIPEGYAEKIARARATSEADYREGLAFLEKAGAYFDAFFKDYDAILTPSALGQAPLMTEGTGDPICCTVWTFAGLPCLSLPWLSGADGLPVGVQLVGCRERDDRLFRTAAWLERQLSQDGA